MKKLGKSKQGPHGARAARGGTWLARGELRVVSVSAWLVRGDLEMSRVKPPMSDLFTTPLVGRGSGVPSFYTSPSNLGKHG